MFAIISAAGTCEDVTMEERVLSVIYGAIDEINEPLPKAQQCEKGLDSTLFGQEGPLDSLGITILIVTLEQRIEQEFDTYVSLTDENIMSFEHSPFLTVSTLVKHISSLLENR